MINYRRLISYIYAYEGDVKGKNIGFVKLESRNGQCRLSVSVKKVYVGSSDLGVYLLAPGREIWLGNMFVRGGAGEFRSSVSVENAADSGCTLEECYGLTIHEKDEAWRSYMTIWEDAVTQAAQVELSELTSEMRGNVEEQIHRKVLELNREMRKEGQEMAAQEVALPAGAAAPGTFAHVPAPSGPPRTVRPHVPSLTAAAEPQPAQESEAQSPGAFETKSKLAPASEPQSPAAVAGQSPAAAGQSPAAAGQLPAAAKQLPTTAAPETPQLAAPPPPTPPEELIPIENREALERLEQEEQQQNRPQQLWDSFRKRYPKIQAFESPGGCEILTIRPQDIGLLPRETWNFGNNSFLLHGFYNYRYLILAKVGDETKGHVRYILGVPGHYYSNEKYMASMFGFPHFVLSKKQPSQDGRFGYWYTDVKMEVQ